MMGLGMIGLGIIMLIARMFLSFIVIVGVILFALFLKRRSPRRNSELQNMKDELELIRGEVGDIKEQIADIVIKTY